VHVSLRIRKIHVRLAAVASRSGGLRERKKQATRKALREAALKLALERGVDQVRVEEIADAAGVSPRTYNNYFASREQAIVAAVTAEREQRVAEALTKQPPSVNLADAVVTAVVEHFTAPSDEHRDALIMITSHPGLRRAYLDSATSIEQPLSTAIATRLGATDRTLTSDVLAAGVAAAVRVALRRWTQPARSSALVVPTGSLADLLTEALQPLAAAFAEAERSAGTASSV